MTRSKEKSASGARADMGGVPPTVLTIFGATGDLAADYLLPTFLHMHEEGLLPKGFRLVCVGRRDLTDESYLDFISKKSTAVRRLTSARRQSFLKLLTYFRADFEHPESFVPLAALLRDREQPSHRCYNRLYYFATSPQLFASAARILQSSGLLLSCEAHQRKVRILVEKPFGFNQRSARDLNRLLLKFFSEDQIYRIDHYQGKETVQNLLVARFANSVFEPLWNNRHIDHIEISVLEKDTAESRLSYYDQTGALKDMVQNHILQILALLIMDQPKDFTADLIRDRKVEVLRRLRPFSPKSAAVDSIKGQYRGYRAENGDSSRTETFAAVRVFVDTPRWRGVPMYLRTGKALEQKLTEVSVHFKEPDRCIFKNCSPNVLAFRIQPDESVRLRLNNKVPGFGMDLHQGDYEFGYDKAYATRIPGAYERLLLDFIQGDQRLFIRSDEIEAAWKFIDTVSESWKDVPIRPYKPGSQGPREAENFLGRSVGSWWV